jgi:hypothetical protein
VVPVDAFLPRSPGWRRYKWLWAVAIVFFGANRVLNRSFTLLLFGYHTHNKQFSVGTQQ